VPFVVAYLLLLLLVLPVVASFLLLHHSVDLVERKELNSVFAFVERSSFSVELLASLVVEHEGDPTVVDERNPFDGFLELVDLA